MGESKLDQDSETGKNIKETSRGQAGGAKAEQTGCLAGLPHWKSLEAISAGQAKVCLQRNTQTKTSGSYMDCGVQSGSEKWKSYCIHPERVTQAMSVEMDSRTKAFGRKIQEKWVGRCWSMFSTKLNLTRKVSKMEEWFKTTSYFPPRGSFWGDSFSVYRKLLGKLVFSTLFQHFTHTTLSLKEKWQTATLPNPCDCGVWGAQESSPLLGEGLPMLPHLQLQGAGRFHGPFDSKQVSLPISNLTLPQTTDALCLENKVT